MKKILLTMLIFAILVLAGCTQVTEQEKTEEFYEKIPIVDAYFEGEKIWFIHTDVTDPEVSETLTKMVNFRTAEYTKICKYKANTGKWYYRDGDTDIEVPGQTFAADMENARGGWVKFVKGCAPELIFDHADGKSARPNDDWQACVEFYVWGGVKRPEFGGEAMGARQMLCTSFAGRKVIERMYADWAAQHGEHPGKAPVFRTDGAQTHKYSNGTSALIANMQLIDWLDMPPELAEAIADRPQGSYHAQTAKPTASVARPVNDPAKQGPIGPDDDVADIGGATVKNIY